MTSNGRDTPGPGRFDTFEPLPISPVSCWRCPHFKRAKIGFHARFGIKLFHQRLVGCRICPSESVRDENADPALVTAFLDWFQTHRGGKPPTLRLYGRGPGVLLQPPADEAG